MTFKMYEGVRWIPKLHIHGLFVEHFCNNVDILATLYNKKMSSSAFYNPMVVDQFRQFSF